MVAGKPQNVVYAYTPVTSPIEQRARLVVETQAEPDRLVGGQAGRHVRPDQLRERAARGRGDFTEGHEHPPDPPDRGRPARGPGHAGDHDRQRSTRLLHWRRGQPVGEAMTRKAVELCRDTHRRDR